MDALHKALAGDTNSIIAVAMTSIVVLVTFIWVSLGARAPAPV